MDENRINQIKLKLLKYNDLIAWKNNATCTSVSEMVAAAKMNLDCGKDKTILLMPNKGFHAWVAYCFVYTRLYNRDRPDDEPELLDIIRTVL